MEIKEECIIYRKGNDLYIEEKLKDQSENQDDDNFERLLEISHNEKTYELIPNKYEFDETENICTLNTAWFLLKKSKMESKLSKYQIHQGDIVKIGRITLRIKEIKFNNNQNNNRNNNNSNEINVSESNTQINKNNLKQIETTQNDLNDLERNHQPLSEARDSTNADMTDKIQIMQINKQLPKKTSSITSLKIKKTKICRICYTEDETNENPLVQPCKCSGSMRFIHLDCLKHWISTRSFIKLDGNEDCSVFLFKQIECELCKTKLGDYLEHNGTLYPLLDFTSEFKNYLTMESLTLDKSKNKFIYVVSLNESKKIKIGRGHNSNILLSDISVSRVHCKMVIEGKNIYLEDNNSKFGTLILIQTPTIKLVENLPLYFQVGRTFFEFILKKPFKFFGCCGVSEKPNIYFYHRQNEKQIDVKRTLIIKTEEQSISSSGEEGNEKLTNKNPVNEIDNLISEHVNESRDENNNGDINIKKTYIDPEIIKSKGKNNKKNSKRIIKSNKPKESSISISIESDNL